ncbi:MAG: hypothetical protein ISS33_03670 [Candidatus Omnitrophica bacterium]|nr:hypothetical protein [Candidatus Omnitrophota bacterium]
MDRKLITIVVFSGVITCTLVICFGIEGIDMAIVTFLIVVCLCFLHAGNNDKNEEG